MNFVSKLARSVNDKIGQSNTLAYFIYKLLPSNDVLFGRDYRSIKSNLDLKAPPQKQKLQLMLNFAIQNVPYYKKVGSTNYEDFPPIDKTTIAEKEAEFFSTTYRSSDYELITSGGTSGVPANYFSPRKRYKNEYAYFHFLWEKVGYKNQLRAVLRNTKLPANKDHKINPITRELVFDAFRNTDAYFLKIYEIIKQYKLAYLQAYPSSAYNFLNFCNQNNLDVSFLKGIFLSSEAYLDYQQKLFEKELNLKVISVYGHAERLILIYRDLNTGDHYVFNQYGFFDLIDENEDSITEENKLGEIVGTTIDNFGYPIIKYRTGDYTSYKNYDPNGIHTLNEIVSRRNDMKIYNEDGSYVSPTALNMHGSFYTKIRGMQYVQKRKGELTIKIVKSKHYEIADENFLRDFMKNRFASSTRIKIEYVDKMKKTSSGKNLLLETFIS
ncbi:MAG: hypothetical protein WBG46_10615 [Nonlabens sp.]